MSASLPLPIPRLWVHGRCPRMCLHWPTGDVFAEYSSAIVPRALS